MKKKALVLALTSALVAPQAFAAQDTSGMQYTSAAEGFYASIRARYNSTESRDQGNSVVENSSSRIGVRGSNDLGGGLEGFYQWELGVGIENNSATSVRLGHVGLRGNFGDVAVGSVWNHMYNRTYGSTDIANHGSGNLVYNTELPGRENSGIQYNTPNLNGFSAGLHATMKGTDGNDNDVDSWGLSADYAVSGFSVGAAYSNTADGRSTLTSVGDITADVADDNDADTDPQTLATSDDVYSTDDATAIAVKAGYAQDNWYVNAWYAEVNNSDNGATLNNTVVNDAVTAQAIMEQNYEDTEILSFAAGIAVDKTNLYLVHETADNVGGNNGVEDAYTTVGVQYNLGANSRVWLEYIARDLDSQPMYTDGVDYDEDDTISIGMQHNF